jgi:DNA-binding transcriptional MerR regulator
MMNDQGQPAERLRPSVVAKQLGVSSATLRRWSRRFEEHLDLADGEGRTHRRYTAADLALLTQVKGYLEQGWTYEQVAVQLDQDQALTGGEEPSDPVPAIDESDEEAPLDSEESVTFISAGQEDPGGEHLPAESLPPAAQFLRDAVQAVAENQQIILNSQQASRDMLGVMIQDNLNLKGENTSLRERMLDLERELAEQRRRHTDYRERMETRVRVLEDAVGTLMANNQNTPSPPQQQTARQPERDERERRSFWQRLIGG